MSSTMLPNLKRKVLAKIKIDTEKLNQILSYIETKPIDSYLYPDKITEDYSISMKNCIELMILLEYFGFLKKIYKIYCSECNDFVHETFETINDVEDYEFCNECDMEFDFENDLEELVYVIYKVII